MIVKERWKCLSDKDKAIYVMHARYLEEKKLYQLIQDFYAQRIEAAKACCSNSGKKIQESESLNKNLI